MNTLTLSVILVNLSLTIGLAAFASVRFRRLESLVKGSIDLSHHLSAETLREEEFSLWSYQNDQWQLVRPCSAPGLEVGSPPGRTGRFGNEIVRTRGIKTRTPVAV